jgi:hypothetical protein
MQQGSLLVRGFLHNNTSVPVSQVGSDIWDLIDKIKQNSRNFRKKNIFHYYAYFLTNFHSLKLGLN